MCAAGAACLHTMTVTKPTNPNLTPTLVDVKTAKTGKGIRMVAKPTEPEIGALSFEEQVTADAKVLYDEWNKKFDRSVHAVTADGVEVVRYDKAGKWFVENPDGTRRPITLPEAAELGAAAQVDPRGRMRFDLSGGQAFDARVRRLLGYGRRQTSG